MSISAMEAQVESLPHLLSSEFDQLHENVRQALSPDEWRRVSRVVTTGCGDSHMACVATQWAFERLAGVPTDAAVAMRAGRYTIPAAASHDPGATLVIAVSVSGNVSRTREAVSMARQLDMLNIALTGNSESPLGQLAERVLDCRIPDFVHAPGVRSYRISLLALWLTAVHMGRMNGTLTETQAGKWVEDLKELSVQCAETIEKSRGPARAAAEELKECEHLTFVGDGPNNATALFGAAKILEAVGFDSWGQDTEEWAHLQYFSRYDSGAPTVVIDSDGPGHGRMAEVLHPMNRIGRKIYLVAGEDSVLADSAHLHLPVAKGVDPLFAPMVNAIPCELLAAYVADVCQAEYFGGSAGPYEQQLRGGNSIYDSKIVNAADVAA